VQAWAPYFQKDIKTHEKVQQRATKFVKAIKKGRLACLGLYSLERRRLWGDLIKTFKILNGFGFPRSREINSSVERKPLNLEDTMTHFSRADRSCCATATFLANE